jgi:hypothetical protein
MTERRRLGDKLPRLLLVDLLKQMGIGFSPSYSASLPAPLLARAAESVDRAGLPFLGGGGMQPDHYELRQVGAPCALVA